MLNMETTFILKFAISKRVAIKYMSHSQKDKVCIYKNATILVDNLCSKIQKLILDFEIMYNLEASSQFNIIEMKNT